MINDYLQPEDFLMDDTFKKYCEGSDERSILFWDKWIIDNPSKLHLIEKARYMYQILSANMAPMNVEVKKVNEALQENEELPKRHILRYAAIAASFFIVLTVGILYYIQEPKQPARYSKSFETVFGSKKKIVLPDGTQVYLNSGSQIELEEGFNTDSRSVHLSGEAYFDVIHNKDKPFKVFTDNFKVTVLGTVFNLKAYPNARSSEASLIRGSIKIEGNDSDESVITLRSGQKIIYYQNKQKSKSPVNALSKLPKVEISHLTTLDTNIVETAWVENNLIFNDLAMKEIGPMLERWYGIDVELGDSDVTNYRFTAIFKKENIVEVLKALQEVKHFNFKMKGGRITITK
jgi:transmembrane sensor